MYFINFGNIQTLYRIIFLCGIGGDEKSEKDYNETMLTDAHCHPFDLAPLFPQAEEERRRLGVMAATNACDLEEITHNERLKKSAAEKGVAPVFPCFAIHPQMFFVMREKFPTDKELIQESEKLLALLEKLASEGRIAAIGECGFDLFNAAFKETEALQDRVFAAHLEIAMRYNLPVVLHVRRAMHKVFAAAKSLAKCKAVVFHSWSCTLEEGGALLRRGVNAYFSFGNAILNGHKQAMRCCAMFPEDRLLTETDAPFQPPKGANFSQWSDLSQIIKTMSVMRHEAGSVVYEAEELEMQIERNFREVF